MDIKSVAIIGSGSMGTAILTGLIKAGLNPANTKVSTKSQQSAAALIAQYGVQAFAQENSVDANAQAAAGVEVVILGVKPAYITEVAAQIAPTLAPNAVVISVAAGIPIRAIEERLPAQIAVIRAMPNTPALIGRGVTGLAMSPGQASTDSTSNAGAPQASALSPIEIATQLFETVGKVLVVEESQIDALSTISGSGPAYVFLLMETFTKSAMALGFTQEQAELMVHETFAGASELVAQTGEDPAELRRKVTSPNGTTMQAIARFESADLHNVFVEATEAALKRAKEIASELG